MGNRSQPPVYSHFSLQGVNLDAPEDAMLPKDSSQPPASAEPKLSTTPPVSTGSAPPLSAPTPPTPHPVESNSPTAEPIISAEPPSVPRANSRSSRHSAVSEKDVDRTQRGFNPSPQHAMMESINDSDSSADNAKPSSVASVAPKLSASRPSSRRGLPHHRTSSIDSSLTAESMIINPGRPQEASMQLEMEEAMPEPQYQSDVEQFIQSVSAGVRKLRNGYSKCFSECSEFLQNDRLMTDVFRMNGEMTCSIERIDANDSDMRMKLNKKMERKFDKDVSKKTFEIKEQVGEETRFDGRFDTAMMRSKC